MAKSKRTEKTGTPPETQAANAQVNREAVVVLPMHRSGSSALSRILSLLGCDLPKTLMLGNETNPTGHWESVEIRALNDDILASGGSQWQDWQAFSDNWYKTPKPAEFRTRALKVLQDEFGSSSLFVFKDPRVCRIFPFWRDTFAAAKIKPKIILTVRHPQEVAASLERRKDNGIPILLGLLLWLRHMLEAEAETRGMKRAVVSFDRLMQDPLGIAESLQDELDLFWPSLSELQADAIRDYINPSLRHHNAAAELKLSRAPEFREWLDEVYEIFVRWSREGEKRVDHPSLDAVRAKLNALAGPLHQMVKIVTSQADELKQQVAQIASLSENNRETEEELTKARAALEEQDRENTRLAHELPARDEVIEDLQSKLSSLKSTLEQRSHEAEEMTSKVAATQAQLTQASAEGNRLRSENTQLASELESRDAVIDDLQGKLHTLRSELEQRSHEAEETAQALTVAQAQIRQLEQRSHETEETEAALTAAHSQISELEQAKNALQQALAKAEDTRRANVGQIEDLQTELKQAHLTLKDRDNAITKLNEGNDRLDKEAAAQAGEMAQMAQLILEKEEVLKRRNSDAHQAQAEVTSLRQDLERARKELEARSHDLAAAEGERQALLRSTSWKLTAPLRRLSMMLKR
ncbi:hypothetical protein [Donghicola eburneus]|uniref:hypothetical protein n=1 Tax=Donghicola eburneus TaxID=393278 RepID=UPI0008F11B53|nr:hypothetical protein [Donghicola eburneus]SFQ70617.1 hypothetical protein SAMN05421764_11126 [Donghicola eburneus]